MKIGFDAKRAFMNYTGLGNYSRNTLRALLQNYPDHDYYLFTPDIRLKDFEEEVKKFKNVTIVRPSSGLFKAYWRSYTISNLIKKFKLDVYHGLSNELPFNIKKSGVKKAVVTIHDLIPFKEDVFRNPFEDFFYKRKMRSAAKQANHIIAISEATAHDVESQFHVHPDKIEVVYQPVPDFSVEEVSEKERTDTINRYKLPETYLLQVGRVEYRKNIQVMIRAIKKLREDGHKINYLVVGRKTRFFKSLKSFVDNFKLNDQIQFLNPVTDKELAVLYQKCTAVAYPSLYEGFGLPVVEGIAHGKPVLTTKGGCFEEAGGDGAIYCDSMDVVDVKKGILNVMENDHTALIEKGKAHIQEFTLERTASELIQVYSQ